MFQIWDVFFVQQKALTLDVDGGAPRIVLRMNKHRFPLCDQIWKIKASHEDFDVLFKFAWVWCSNLVDQWAKTISVSNKKNFHEKIPLAQRFGAESAESITSEQKKTLS